MSQASKQTEFNRNRHHNVFIHPVTNLIWNTTWNSLLFILLALLLILSSIHIRAKHLPILVHTFRVNTIYPSLLNQNFTQKIYDNRNLSNLPDKGIWETRDRLCHPSLITKSSNTIRKGSHTGNKPIDVRMASWYKICIVIMFLLRFEIYMQQKKSYAKKSSTTVDRVLYIIAFIGICATLCIQILNSVKSNVMMQLPWVCSW